MIDLSKYRIIDLSYELVPGERKVDGTYLPGEPFRYGRSVEVEEFISFNERMHFIHSQTHVGTHVEAPYKHDENGTDVGAMPVESYIGEAVVCDVTQIDQREVTPTHLREHGVKEGDIVLIRGAQRPRDERPYMSFDSIDWLLQTGIKAFGAENVTHTPPGTPFGRGAGDARFLLAGVPVLDALVGLDQITRPRVFFIGLPVKIRRVTASWARAIVLQEISGVLGSVDISS